MVGLCGKSECHVVLYEVFKMSAKGEPPEGGGGGGGKEGDVDGYMTYILHVAHIRCSCTALITLVCE